MIEVDTFTCAKALKHTDLLPLMADMLQEQADALRSKIQRITGAELQPLYDEVSPMAPLQLSTSFGVIRY